MESSHMEIEAETSLVVLIQALNSAVIASISELIPAIQNTSQASQLRQELQRLRIWSNDLGIERGGLKERLRGEQELKYSLVTLHIMIAQGLITAEKCVGDTQEEFLVGRPDTGATQSPLQLAVATLEKQYPQFSDGFSATTASNRTQSDNTGDGIPAVPSDASHDDTANELDESLAEVSSTIDRLLRLAPFLEQFLEVGDEHAVHDSYASISEEVDRETKTYVDRILTRFPQASHQHVQIIVAARQRSHPRNTSDRLQNTDQSGLLIPQPPLEEDAFPILSDLERSIVEDPAIPYPSMPKLGKASRECHVCGMILPPKLSLLAWVSHILEDFEPFVCLERTCAYPIISYRHLIPYYIHTKRPHEKKPQWTCKLCGSSKFAAKSQLQYHAETIHYIPAEAAIGLCELWKDDVSAQEDETECVFCNEPYGTEEFARIAHLGRHMVEISLLMPEIVTHRDNLTSSSLSTPLGRQNYAMHLKKLPTRMSGNKSAELGPESEESAGCSSDESIVIRGPTKYTEEESNEEDSDPDKPNQVPNPPYRIVQQAEFILEKIDSNDDNNEIEVIRPDAYENASENEAPKEPKSVTFDRLQKLQIDDDSSSEDKEERQRRYLRKKKRWSAGRFKRSHSQSFEGDSSYSDYDTLDNINATARRLRRRVRGSGEGRASLIFEDKGTSGASHIVETSEPDDGHTAKDDQGQRDERFTLDELPFADVMELDSH